MIKLYQTRAWLKRRFVDQGKSVAEIAREAKVSEMTIRRYLEKEGLL